MLRYTSSVTIHHRWLDIIGISYWQTPPALAAIDITYVIYSKRRNNFMCSPSEHCKDCPNQTMVSIASEPWVVWVQTYRDNSAGSTNIINTTRKRWVSTSSRTWFEIHALYGNITENTWSQLIINMANHHQQTWSTIINTHGDNKNTYIEFANISSSDEVRCGSYNCRSWVRLAIASEHTPIQVMLHDNV
jgi:hypothetical protein